MEAAGKCVTLLYVIMNVLAGIGAHGTQSQAQRGMNLKCPGCQMANLSSQAVRRFRIELIKNQILAKLRLNSPPKVEGTVGNLPTSLLRQLKVKNREEDFQNDDDKGIESYFAKTMEMMIFPEIESNCRSSEPSSCLKFNFTQIPAGSAVRSAKLWVHIHPAVNKGSHIFTLAAHPVIPRQLILTTNSSSGWIQFSLNTNFGRWLRTTRHRRIQRVVKITCRSCSENAAMIPILLTGEHRPFLEVLFKPVRHRSKRHALVCTRGMSTCCKEKLRFKFSDIGWDFVVQPQYYDDYYCKGTCTGSTNLMTNHSMIMQTVGRTKPEMLPCCAPNKVGSMSMLYREGNSVKYVTISEMSVTSCGCA